MLINARNAAATVARVAFRDTWNAAAPTITRARPSAASGVSHVAMLTAPGRISPSECHYLRPRGDRPFDRNVLLGEYLLQSGRREQMQHRMQHEERGQQNLQDPQSNIHWMIAFSASRTQMLQLASMVAKAAMLKKFIPTSSALRTTATACAAF